MWIGHLDLDAFFARCEKLRNPDIEDKPVVVCVYTREGDSGAVSTCCYRARELGIESGMPLQQARERATGETVFLPVDRELYSQKSERVMSILNSNSRDVEKRSIDEAYFRLETNPERKARKIKADVEALGLSVSVGVAPNKFLAKMASEEDKPSGLKVVREDREDFMSEKKVEQVHGIGPRTAEKLRSLGIEKCSDLRDADNSMLASEFGREKAASLRARASGKGSTDLETDDRKQMSRIRTMPRNSSEYEFLRRQLRIACKDLWDRIERKEKAYRRITVIGIDTDLKTHTRSTRVDTSDRADDLVRKADQLLEDLAGENMKFRRIGIRVSDLVDIQKQSSLSSF